ESSKKIMMDNNLNINDIDLSLLRLSSPRYSHPFFTAVSPETSPLKRSSPVSDESDHPKRRKLSPQNPIFTTCSPLLFTYPETQSSSIHVSGPVQETTPYASSSSSKTPPDTETMKMVNNCVEEINHEEETNFAYEEENLQKQEHEEDCGEGMRIERSGDGHTTFFSRFHLGQYLKFITLMRVINCYTRFHAPSCLSILRRNQTLTNSSRSRRVNFSLCSLSKTQMELPDLSANTVIDHPRALTDKITLIRDAGPSKFQVIADFDATLTKYRVNGLRGLTSHGLLQQGNTVYDDKRQALYEHYHPLEISPVIPIEEKTKLMEEWWSKTHDLLIEGGLTYDAIKKSVENS
ncbi:hypothetical protein AALP_AAs43429U000100, partial [Arabis alpina]